MSPYADVSQQCVCSCDVSRVMFVISQKSQVLHGLVCLRN